MPYSKNMVSFFIYSARIARTVFKVMINVMGCIDDSIKVL